MIEGPIPTLSCVSAEFFERERILAEAGVSPTSVTKMSGVDGAKWSMRIVQP
jgi:hypothetical protein